MSPCFGLCGLRLAVTVPAAEVVASEADLPRLLLSHADEDPSSSLYCMLVLLTRCQPPNVAVNSGTGEGLVAATRLVETSNFGSSCSSVN